MLGKAGGREARFSDSFFKESKFKTSKISVCFGGAEGGGWRKWIYFTKNLNLKKIFLKGWGEGGWGRVGRGAGGKVWGGGSGGGGGLELVNFFQSIQI